MRRKIKYKRRTKVYPIAELLKRGKRFNLLSSTDFDKSLSPALMDCEPYNRKKEGSVGTIFVTPSEYGSVVGGSGPTTGAGIVVATSSDSPGGTGTYVGGGRGGGRQRIGESPKEYQARLKREAKARADAAAAAAEAKRIADAKAAYDKRIADEQTAYNKRIKEQNIRAGKIEGQIDIARSGGVTTGGVRYTGGAVIPGTGGMTANEYTRMIRGQAISGGQVSSKDIGYTSFSIAPQQVKQEPSAIDTSGLFGGWGAGTLNNYTLSTLPSTYGMTGRVTRTDITPQFKTPSKPFGERVVEYAFGSPHIPLFSIATPLGAAGTPEGLTISEFKRGVGSFGDIPAGVAGLIPETRAGLVATTGALYVAPMLPKVIRIGTGVFFTAYGAKGALDVTKPTSERITSGIIGGTALVGTAFESIPYIKGLYAKTIGRFTGKYKPIKTQQELFKAVELQETRIGLIPEKSPLKTGETAEVKLPKVSPLKRGGFGVKASEKELFLGGEQYLTTSQRGFFKAGKEKVLTEVIYTTPQEPFVKIPETRVSRLGLSDLFKFNKQAQVGFGLPKSPQIGITRGVVTRTGKAGTYQIGKGTELEATALGTIAQVKKVGITTIKGEGVDIFTFNLGKISGTGARAVTPTTMTTSAVSGESIISGVLGTGKIATRDLGIPSSVITAPSKPTAPIQVYKTPPDVMRIPVSKPTTPKAFPKTPSPPKPTKPSPPITKPTSPTKPTTLLSPVLYPTKPSLLYGASYKETSKNILFGKMFKRLKFGEKQKPFRQQKPMVTRYQPSFTGLGIGLIVSPKDIKDYERKGFGAFRIRGIVSRKQTKKTRKSRKKSRKQILGV